MTAAWTAELEPELERPRSQSAPRQPRKVDGSREEKRRHAYVEAALRGESEAVRNAPKGTRNQQLNTSAFALGQLVGAGHISEDEVITELTDAAQAAGLAKVETQKTIASGMNAGKAEPRQIPEPEPSNGFGNGYDGPPPGRFEEDEPERAPAPVKPTRSARSVADVLEQWKTAGPLVHEPTGIQRLDELTGGGFVYGSRVYVAGAPDAGKTLWLLQLAHVWLQRGVVVGLLAVDEEPTDIVMRVAQRVGYARHHCEIRDPMVMAELADVIGTLPLRLYDDTWTIEAAAADLAAAAKGARSALLIDSVQTATCERESTSAVTGHEMSEVSAVTARVRAIRAVATKYKIITVATSELGRNAYKSSDPSQQTNTMASAKWSGAIEYSARVLLGLRSVSDEPDLVELEVAKNKHGPRDERIHLRIDRKAQTLTEVRYEPEPEAPPAERKVARTKAETAADARAVVAVLQRQPGLKARELRAAMRAAAGIGHDRVDAALALLGPAVMREPGPNRAQHMSVDLSRLSEDERKALEVAS